MSYFKTAAVIDGKLAELLEEHNLVHHFKVDRYPIVLEVSPDASPAGQMNMLADADGPVSSYDARLRLIFAIDGTIEIQTDNRIVVSDTLLNKIKGLGKKYLAAFTYSFFADRRIRDEFSVKQDDKAEE